MRAVYSVLPERFDLDADGRKAAWRENFVLKLRELVKKEQEEVGRRGENANQEEQGVGGASGDTTSGGGGQSRGRLEPVGECSDEEGGEEGEGEGSLSWWGMAQRSCRDIAVECNRHGRDRQQQRCNWRRNHAYRQVSMQVFSRFEFYKFSRSRCAFVSVRVCVCAYV